MSYSNSVNQRTKQQIQYTGNKRETFMAMGPAMVGILFFKEWTMTTQIFIGILHRKITSNTAVVVKAAFFFSVSSPSPLGKLALARHLPLPQAPTRAYGLNIDRCIKYLLHLSLNNLFPNIRMSRYPHKRHISIPACLCQELNFYLS